MSHANNPALLGRLRRAHGHLHSVIAMVEEGRSCLGIAQQLHAVEAAVANAKKFLIQDHIEHCLEGSGGEQPVDTSGLVRDLKTLAKYL